MLIANHPSRGVQGSRLPLHSSPAARPARHSMPFNAIQLLQCTPHLQSCQQQLGWCHSDRWTTWGLKLAEVMVVGVCYNWG